MILPSTGQSFLLSFILLLKLFPQIIHASCAACSNYAYDLSTCTHLFSGAVTNPKSGTINGNGISCMCVTGSGLNNMVNCYKCGQLAGFDLSLLESWILTCNTDHVSGPGAALDCWNSDQSLCVPLQGVQLPDFVSSSSQPGPTSSVAMTGSAAGITPGPTASSSPSSASTTTTTKNEAGHLRLGKSRELFFGFLLAFIAGTFISFF